MKNKSVTRLLIVGLVAALSASCSAEAKKNRLAKRAEEYFKAGDYERAKIEYTNLLRADPQNPEPYEKIGRMWLEEGAPLRAGPFMVRARDLAPARAEIRTKLGELYITLAGLNEARQEALEALRMQPGNMEALLVLADAARTPEEIAQAEEELRKNPRPDSASYNLAEATIALRKGSTAGMEAALLKAVAADPKSATAHTALARFRHAQGNTQAAGEAFKLAASLAPPRAPAHLFLAEFKAQTGARDEAIAHLNEIVKKAPDYLPAWTMLAKLTAPKSYDEALALLDNVFRRDTQNFDARLMSADFQITKGNPKDAVETLRQLETAYPQVPMVKFLLARAHVASGDSAEAITSLQQTIQIAPNHTEAVLLLAELNLRTNNPGPVVSAMDEFLKTNPNSDRAQVMLADAYRALGRFDEAVAILQKQIAAAPNKFEPYLLFGVLMRQQNKNAEARQALEKAFELAPGNVHTLNQLVELDLIAQDYASAMRRVNERLEKSPDSEGLLLQQGKIFAAQRDWNNAEAALQKVMQLNANIPAAYELLVSTYIGANKLPEAVRQVETFLAKAPNNIGALMTLALIYNEMKEFEKARDAYEKLLAVKPDIVMAMNNLAYIYSDRLNQLDKAKEWAAKAHAADPANPAIADTFGWILHRQGDYKGAVAMLKEAAEKLPNEPEVQHHLGMASYMMGDSSAARTAFEAAARSPRDFPGKEEAKRRLALLTGTAGSEEMNPEQLAGLLKEQPNDPLALVKLGEEYEKQGAAAKAAESYEQALKINPTLPTATLKLAQLYAGPLQKKDRALELAKKARDLAPGDSRTTAVLGRLAFQAGNYSWAYSLLQESARQLSGDPVVQRDLAWAAYSNGKVPEARQALERAAKAGGDSPEAADAKRFLALIAPETEKAATDALPEEAQAALKEDPNHAPALMLQARFQNSRGDRDAAVKAYSQVLSRFPEFAPAQKQLAALYLEDPANRVKAYELATAARKVLQDDAELAAILGEASYHKKDYGRAVQLLQDSDRKKPLEAKQLYYLGLSLAEVKQRAAAGDVLRRAITAGLKEPLASEAKEKLNDLEPKS